MNPTGSGDCYTSVQDAAAPAQDGDTIQIAAGTYSDQHLDTTEDLTIVGVGAGTLDAPSGTVLVAPTGDPALVLRGASTVRDLAVIGGEGTDTIAADLAIDIRPGSDATEYTLSGVVLRSGNVDEAEADSGQPALFIYDPGAQGTVVRISGSQLGGGTSVTTNASLPGLRSAAEDVTLHVSSSLLRAGSDPNGAASAGLEFAAGVLTLTDVVASGARGVSVTGGSATFSRSVLTGSRGPGVEAYPFDQGSVSVDVADSVIASQAQAGPAEEGALDLSSFNGSDAVTATVRGSTIYVEGQYALAAVYAERNAGPVTVSLANTAVARAPGAAPTGADIYSAGGSISAATSVFGTSAAVDGGSVPAAGTGTNLAADPGFANPAALNFTPLPGSPLVDRADPALVGASTLDLVQSPRSIDGNGDCLAAPDIGAIELTGQAAECVNPAPAVTGFGLTNKVFAPKGVKAKSSQRKKAVKRGTTFRFTLSEAAQVRILLERRVAGRRVRRNGRNRCVKPTRKNRAKRRCRRFVRAGTLNTTGQPGPNTLPFSGRVRGKPLRPGRYRATITAVDSQAAASVARRVSFRIVRP